jgi:hypothetical protein
MVWLHLFYIFWQEFNVYLSWGQQWLCFSGERAPCIHSQSTHLSSISTSFTLDMSHSSFNFPSPNDPFRVMEGNKSKEKRWGSSANLGKLIKTSILNKGGGGLASNYHIRERSSTYSGSLHFHTTNNCPSAEMFKLRATQCLDLTHHTFHIMGRTWLEYL